MLPGQTSPPRSMRLIKEFAAQGWIKKGFDADETAYANAIRAVTMIPAATEWAYAPYEVLRDFETAGGEVLASENAFSFYSGPDLTPLFDNARNAGRIGGPKCDWATSLNSLQQALPNVRLVNLFVSWFGTDLRAVRMCARSGRNAQRGNRRSAA